MNKTKTSDQYLQEELVGKEKVLFWKRTLFILNKKDAPYFVYLKGRRKYYNNLFSETLSLDEFETLYKMIHAKYYSLWRFELESDPNNPALPANPRLEETFLASEL